MWSYCAVLFCVWACLLWPSVAAADATVQLPEDDAVIHRSEMQWHYWTGFLTRTDKDKSKSSVSASFDYGVEVCVFVVGDRIQVVHVAVSDVAAQSFTYRQTTELTKPTYLNSSFAFESAITKVQGGDGHDSLSFTNANYALDLTVDAVKPPTIHYQGEKHKYAFPGWTYYYSRTKMTGTGTLTIDDEPVEVQADLWFDRQWGNLVIPILQGWQWFSISLADNTEVMLFNFEGEQDEPNYGSITDANGVATELFPEDFTVSVLDQWVSPHTNCTYPSGWEVTLTGSNMTYTVQPVMKDQELNGQGIPGIWLTPIYWEGAAMVTDSKAEAVGNAYVELNGFCKRHLSKEEESRQIF